MSERTVTPVNSSGHVNEAYFVESMGHMIEPAFHALQGYGQVVHQANNRGVNHPLRVGIVLRDFTDDFIDHRGYSAALLHDIAQRVDDRFFGKNAIQALRTFSTDDGVAKSDWEYVSALLGDMDIVEEYSEGIRHADHNNNNELRDVLGSKSGNQPGVPIWMWNSESGLTDPSKMFELLEKVNLESVLIKSAEMLDNLMYPSDKDRAVLQDIFDAESFYAPLCEVIGFDGMAMALRGTAAQIRLEKSGNVGVLQAARAELEAIGDREFVARAISGLFAEFIGGDSIVEHVVDNKAQHQVTIGESLLQHPSLGESETMRAVWRVKTLGSLAIKLARGKSAYDAIGITLMANDTDQLATVYRLLVEKVQRGHEEGTVMHSGEDKTYDIRGDENFLAKMLEAVGPELATAETLGTTQNPVNGYEVAKMTIKYIVADGGSTKSLPVEIQMQTEEARVRSRIGHASHIAYKAAMGSAQPNAIEFDIETLAKIRERKSMLRSGQLVEASKERGESLRQRVAKSRIRRV